MSPRRRRRKSDDDLFVALGGLVVVGLVLVKVGQWVWAHWWVLVVLGLLALLALAGWAYRQVDQMRSAQLRVGGLTYSLGQLDAMHHSPSRTPYVTCWPGTVPSTRCAAAAGATSAPT